MLSFEYFVFNGSTLTPKNIDPAIWRKVRGIDNAGEEYVGCLSNVLNSLEFYKYNLEVALDKIRKLEYDLKEKSNGTNCCEA